MNNELEEFYFNVALETVRAERSAAAEAESRAAIERYRRCLKPTRAMAIGRGAEPTDTELEHASGCRFCANMVNNFRPEPLPVSALLAAKLMWYCKAPERLLRRWAEAARFNSSIFFPEREPVLNCAPGEEVEPPDPVSFEQGGLSVCIDLRETGKFVVDVTSADGSLCGREVTVSLFGEGGERRVTVQLERQEGGACAGSAVVGASADDVLKSIGPIVIPVAYVDGEPAIALQP